MLCKPSRDMLWVSTRAKLLHQRVFYFYASRMRPKSSCFACLCEQGHAPMANQAPRMRTCNPMKYARARGVPISGQYGAMRWPIRSQLGEFLAHERTHIGTSMYTWCEVQYFQMSTIVRYWFAVMITYRKCTNARKCNVKRTRISRTNKKRACWRTNTCKSWILFVISN